MKPFAISALLCFAATLSFAATEASPSGTRITPPTISAVSPLGVARGATVEVTVEGFNLAKANAVFFSESGIKARITSIKELPDQDDVRFGANGGVSTVDLGPLPPRNQLTLEIDAAADAPIGPVEFRIQTPLGTTPEARIAIEPYYGESPDREPNDTPEQALETFLPTILVGTISKPGDLDYFKITAKAGDRLVFENSAAMLGSALQPVISIYDSNFAVIAQFTEDGGRNVNAFAHKFERGGDYYLRISDYEDSGSPRHFYRIKVGRLPVAISAFPLGVPKGQTADIALTGFNLKASKVSVKGERSAEDPDVVWLRPQGISGASFNRVKLAIGTAPEILATGKAAQSITVPVTVNGKLLSDHQDFRFHARKGQKLILDVNANRLGSPLDSLLEVLDSAAKPIERATIRCILENSVTLRDHDSTGSGMRLSSQAGLAVGDKLMAGGEIVEVRAMPPGPDDDFAFTAFGGQRLAYLDTTPEAHAIDSPVYKVQIAPPGSAFAPNGLPIVHLMYRNDDGGPGYGKDSRLHFTAPADGDYLVRLRDVRGLKGDAFAYRLTVREPVPGFRLGVSPHNPNVPAGERIPLVVTALRLDDFDGPIPVSVQNLPRGLHATEGRIEPGQTSTTLLLSADADAKIETAVPLVVKAANGTEADPADRLKMIALMPRPDVHMLSEARHVTIQPGGRAEVHVSIQRNNGFAGRVPVEILNLPPGVRVIDIGLNGVLINEDEQKRSFTLEALPTAEPLTQPLIVAAAVETRAGGQQNAFAGEPIELHVVAKGTQ